MLNSRASQRNAAGRVQMQLCSSENQLTSVSVRPSHLSGPEGQAAGTCSVVGKSALGQVYRVCEPAQTDMVVHASEALGTASSPHKIAVHEAVHREVADGRLL